MHPKKAKESWLARNPVSQTEQPINLMTIGTLLFNESVEPTIPTPQNGQPSQNSLVEKKANFSLHLTLGLRKRWYLRQLIPLS